MCVVLPALSRDIRGRASRSRGGGRGAGRGDRSSQAALRQERSGAAAVNLNPRRILRIGTHSRTAFWQGWLPALFDESVAELTGVGAAIPSFPFVEMQSGPEQPPPQGVIHQFVMVLVSRLCLSVPEIVMAYALVS